MQKCEAQVWLGSPGNIGRHGTRNCTKTRLTLLSTALEKTTFIHLRTVAWCSELILFQLVSFASPVRYLGICFIMIAAIKNTHSRLCSLPTTQKTKQQLHAYTQAWECTQKLGT